MLRSLPLSRTTVFSLVTMCATVALFATGATFAAWTNSDNAAGIVTASAITIQVNGAGGAADLAFTTGSGCPSALLPGSTCTAQVQIKNLSPTTVLNVVTPATGSIAVTDGVNPTGCTNAPGNWLLGPLDISNTSIAALGTSTFDVSVTLGADAHIGCQGETATVTVTVNAAS